MRKVITGSLESSRDRIRGKDPIPKERLGWSNQAVQAYNKFAKKLTKPKSAL